MVKNKIILASTSPRRIEIFRNIGIDFTVRKDEIEEVIFKEPESTVLYNSDLKISKVIKDDETGIGFDTIVFIDNEIIGKPENKEEAFNFLRKLCNKEHIVYSGFTLVKNNKKISDYDKSFVKFRYYGDIEIIKYIETEEPMDKAGAYAVQGKGINLIERIKGSILNVVGLPLEKLISAFKKTGIDYNEKIVEEYLWNLKQSVGKMVKLE